MVKIYIGPKRKEFVIHKKLICKAADYFDRAFNENFMEGQEVSSGHELLLIFHKSRNFSPNEVRGPLGKPVSNAH